MPTEIYRRYKIHSQCKRILRGDEMTNEDKSILIAGTMFLTLATALFITGIFFMKALGTALLIALATYVFFDTCYYVKKD